jgi:anti-sigma factor RsiW
MTSHDPPMSHQEVQELLGAYALDAVDPEVAAIVEDHLRSCARCAQEVAEHHEVAGLLANSGGAAPSGLWQSIADRLGETRPPSWEQLARGLDVPADPTPSVPVDGSAAVEGSPSPEPGASRRRRRMVRSALVVAAAAIVAVAVVLGVQVGDLHHQLDQARSTSLTQAEQAALAAPTTRQIRLTPPSATGEPATTEVTVVLTRSGAGFVVTHQLPALSSGRTYQLWAVTGEQKISLGLLGSDPGIAPFSVAGNRSVDAFAITAEHAGGVVRTSNTPVVEGVVAI